MKANSRIPVIALDYSQRHKAMPKELLIDYETGHIYVVSATDKSIIFDITNKILQKLDSVTGDKIVIEIEGIGEVNLQEYINRLNTKLEDMIIVNDEEKDVYIPKHERLDNFSIESKYSRIQIKNFETAENGMIPQKHKDTIRWVYPLQSNNDNGISNPNDGISTDIFVVEPVAGKLFLRASRRLITENLQKNVRVILPRTLDKYTEIYWNVTISEHVPSIVFEDCVLFDSPYQISKNAHYIFKFTTWDAGETWYASLNSYITQSSEEDPEDIDTEIDTDKILLATNLTVKGQSIGSYNDGDVIPAGLTLTSILAKQFAKRIPPVYVLPTMSLTASPATYTFESGTKITPTITSVYNREDGGRITRYILDKINNGESTNLINNTDIQPYQQQESITINDGSLLQFKAIINYADGLIKDDNLGEPYPDTSIKAGTLSATITYTGQRKAFFDRDNLTQAVATSADVRALRQSIMNPMQGSKLVIKISTGDTRVTFAYPSHIRDVVSIISSGLNLDVKGKFTQTKISVEGADGYTAKPYKVYTYIPEIPFPGNDTYTVTI